MADRTESSIVIDAAPADVMAVIADLEAYPEWSSDVKTVEVLSGLRGRRAAGRGALRHRLRGLQGRLRPRVRLDRGRARLVGDGQRRVAAQVAGRRVRPRGDRATGTEVTYRHHRRREDPDDRDDQAQGREGHRGHRPEGPQGPRGGLTPSCGSSSSPARAASARRPRPPARRRSLRAQGLKALVLSTDGAHSLGDALGRRAADGASRPRSRPGCSPSRSTHASGSRRAGATVQGYLLEVLDAVGVDPVEAEELTVLPGAEEVLALLEVRDQVRSDRWDLVAVDCAPTAETLRLLALPEALGWYVERVVPGGAPGRALPAPDARPGGRRARCPGTSVLDAAERLQHDLRRGPRVLTAAGLHGPAGAHPGVGRRRRGASHADLARRCSATASTPSSRTGSSPRTARTPGARAGSRPRREQLAEVEASFAPLPGPPRRRTGPSSRSALDGAARRSPRTCTATRDPLRAVADGAGAADVERERATSSCSSIAAAAGRPRATWTLVRTGDELVLTRRVGAPGARAAERAAPLHRGRRRPRRRPVCGSASSPTRPGSGAVSAAAEAGPAGSAERGDGGSSTAVQEWLPGR